MAKQKGVIPLTGLMGGISFYESEGEYRAREKTGPSRDTVLTKQSFARTRENAAEFRRAVRAGTMLRYSLRSLLKTMKLADSGVSGRLHALFTKIVRSDPENDRGERTASKGNLEMLEDFAFHKDHTLSDVFPVGPVSSIDTSTGKMKVTIRSFDPQQRVNAPAGASHFKVATVAAAIDFDKEQYEQDHQETGYLSLDEWTDTICLEHALHAKAGQSLILAMGVVFYTRSEEVTYERVNGGAMRVIQISNSESRISDCSAGQLDDKIMTGCGVTEDLITEANIIEETSLTAKAQGREGALRKTSLTAETSEPVPDCSIGQAVNKAGQLILCDNATDRWISNHFNLPGRKVTDRCHPGRYIHVEIPGSMSP